MPVCLHLGSDTGRVLRGSVQNLGMPVARGVDGREGHKTRKGDQGIP